jgi:putative SOS response-associated peptidase YedK
MSSSEPLPLLKPFDARFMRVYPVSSTMNSANNYGPECADEITVSEDA